METNKSKDGGERAKENLGVKVKKRSLSSHLSMARWAWDK